MVLEFSTQDRRSWCRFPFQPFWRPIFYPLICYQCSCMGSCQPISKVMGPTKGPAWSASINICLYPLIPFRFCNAAMNLLDLGRVVEWSLGDLCSLTFSLDISAAICSVLEADNEMLDTLGIPVKPPNKTQNSPIKRLRPVRLIKIPGEKLSLDRSAKCTAAAMWEKLQCFINLTSSTPQGERTRYDKASYLTPDGTFRHM